MKVLLSNKFYYRRGGDCVCTINLEELLKQNRHEVAIFAMQHPDNLKTPWSKYFPSEVKFKPEAGMLEALLRPFGTNEVKRNFTALLNDFHPDIVHLNNIHSQLSPVIAEIAHQKGIKVVWTLHDYKLLCPRYDCLRNGETPCEACFLDKHKVLEYKCMKNSRSASYLSYREAVKWNRKRLEACTNLFICPSRFMAEKMRQGGFDSKKLKTVCNFVDTEKCHRDDYAKRENYYCFIGRLSHEKGIRTLIEAANSLPYKLIVIGGGPLEEELKAMAGNNIEFVGFKQWNDIKDLVGKARFNVIPSEWYENNPLSAIEAQCMGTPVLGARIGGIPELIEEGITGMTFESRNKEDLKMKIESMMQQSFDYEAIARKSRERYNAEVYYQQIMQLYQR